MNLYSAFGREHQRLSAADRAAREAAFRLHVDDVKNRHNIIDVAVALGVGKMHKAGGRARKACCPIHRERTPSAYFYPGENNFHCFGCSANGDAITLIMLSRGFDFMAAMAWLGEENLPYFDPAERQKILLEESEERKFMIAAARSFFEAGAEVTRDDPGGRYLMARGIRLPVASTIRFGMVPAKFRDEEKRIWADPRPALICGAQDEEGVFTGCQRIFVDGPKPDKAACKLSLGSLKGSAVRLGPPSGHVIMAEGPEDSMSIAQEIERSVWFPCGTGLMPFVRFPPSVSQVTLAGQNNDAGRAAVEKTRPEIEDQGIAVGATWPAPEYDDWNDQLRGKAR